MLAEFGITEKVVAMTVTMQQTWKWLHISSKSESWDAVRTRSTFNKSTPSKPTQSGLRDERSRGLPS